MIAYDFITQGNAGVNIPVASTAVVYTKHIPVYNNDPSFSFEYKAASAGNVDLKIEIEQGNSDPTNPNASDPAFVVPDEAIEFNNNLTDELLHIKAYPLTPTKFFRFKITGLTGNDASTEITRLYAYVMR